MVLILISNQSTPLYKQIANIIRLKIEQQHWLPDQELPTEEALAQLYSVSRITIRKAENELIEERLLYKERGKTVRVSQPLNHFVNNVTLINQQDAHIEEIFDTKKTLSYHLEISYTDIRISRIMQVPLILRFIY